MSRIANGETIMMDSGLSAADGKVLYPELLEHAADFIADYVQKRAAADSPTDPVQKTTSSHPFILSIDGRAGSGKTTLARLIWQKLDGAALLHLDDFFLQPHQRTSQRLSAPGQNVDYERIIEEVLIPASRGEQISYHPFSCQTMSLQEAVNLGKPRILILEGSYSMNEELRKFADTSVFLTCSSPVQLERILQRNGPEKLQDFINRWIPLEEQYFQTFDPAELCDFVFDVSGCSL